MIKHSILPALVEGFDTERSDEWMYCETHAGYYDYPLSLLMDGKTWKGERAWSIGLIQRLQSMNRLGAYGDELVNGFTNKVYPGSIRIIDAAIRTKRLKRILGWDIKNEQVVSYQHKSARITVQKGDGYRSAQAITDEPKLIFCDPFWTAPNEEGKVKQLLQRETHVIVWYPLSSATQPFRDWLAMQRFSYIEIRYRHWAANRDGWAGQDLRGAGLMLKGLPEVSFNNAVAVARRLKAIFEGQSHPGKPRRGNDGATVVPQDRDLSLRVTASW